MVLASYSSPRSMDKLKPKLSSGFYSIHDP
jgi:hypothetical protein